MPGNSIVLLPNTPTFTIVAATDDYYKTSGRTKEELVHIGIFDAFPSPPDDPEHNGVKQLRASLEKVIQQKLADRMPLVRYDIENADGSFDERYWSAVNKPVMGENGEVQFIIHTAEEMTLQVKAEESASKIKSLEKSYDLFMQAPVTIGVVKGSEYIIELANDNLLEVWGRTSEVIGKSLFEAVPELKEQGFKALLDQVCETQEPFYAYEHPIRLHRYGKEEVVYLDFVYKPYYEDRQAKPVGVLAVGHNVTKQVESRQKFRSVIEESKDPILILMGEELVLDTANQALFNLWQVGPEALGKTFLQILPEMAGQGFDELLRNVLHSGEPFYGKEIPAVFKRKSGLEETVYFDFSYQPYRNPAGSITGVLVMATDVSTRVLTRKKIEESEVYFRQLTDTVPAIIWITRPDGYCTYLNKNWYNYTGQTEGEAEGFGWLEATHPDDAEEAGRRFMEATEKQQPYYILYRLRHKSGEYRWAIDSGQPKFSKDGTFDGMIGTVIDVHEQKLAEDQIRESEKRFRSMADASPVMIWTLDEDGNSTYYNSRAREFTGHTEEDLEAGKSWQVAIHPDDIKYAGDIVGNAVVNRIPYEMECRMQRADGEWRWLLNHGTPRFGSEGEYFGFVGSSVDITERKVAEERIKASEAKFRSVVRDAPAAIGLFVGRDLVIQDPNQAFIDIVGKGWGIVGKPLREAMPELITEGQAYLQILDEVFTTGNTYRTNGSLVKIVQQGVMTHRYYNFTYSPLFDEEGKVWAILDIAIDVTEQVNAQKTIAESEARFRNILEQTPEPMLVLKGEDLVLEVANEPLFRTWHMDESVIGKPLLECLPELKGQGIVEMMLDVYHNKKVIKGYDRPVIYDRGNGVMETMYYNFVYSPYVEANGEVTGILIIGTDVTGSVLARQALEESEARFRTLATTIPQIVWTTDETGRLDYLSNQWEVYTGQSITEGLTENHLMIHPDDVEKLAACWKEAVETGAEWKMDYRIRHKPSGNYRWFTGLTAPLKDNDGRILRWIGTATDIHEQKMFTENLEILVDERTKALQRSNEDLQQFAHVASHDLKEPVRKVKTFIGRLEEHLKDQLDETGTKYIERIHSATARMFTMIDGVLRYSTMNAVTESFQPVNLTEMMKNIETDLEVIIQKTSTRIYYDQLPTIEGAPVLLYQIFYNLVNNSIKFAKSDVAPQISITSEITVEKDRSFAKLILSDNGIGFEDSQAAAIFDTFTRLHPKDKYEGTGLGLALCKKIAERHGGSISAKGILGEGASFTILLPIHQTKRSI